jgi:large subunit ribosomal protein L25
MAAPYVLSAEPRQAGHPNRDRAQGFVPGIVYGHGITPLAVRIPVHDLNRFLARGGAHHVGQLTVRGEAQPRTVVVKEVQRHPVSREVLHVDFQAVSAQERIHAEVPLRIVGEDRVAKGGGILQVLLHNLRVACLPADLPDHVDADVSGLSIGHTLTVGDLTPPPGVTVLNDRDEVIVTVLAPRTAEAATEAGAPAAPAAEEKKE